MFSAAGSRNIPLHFLAEDLGFNEPDSTDASRCELSAPQELGFEIPPAELTLLAARRYWRAKRMFDAAAASVLLLAAAPLLLLTAVCVALSMGFPIVFWQERPGLGGKPFRLYKFRTMRVALAPDGRHLADRERTSIIGSLLRRLRLDELPQLFNILRGDMSFVGPRPLLAREQRDAYRARLLVRPGLTGWAQTAGGRDITFEDKAALDVWYVRNASIALDVKIALKTIPTALFLSGGQAMAEEASVSPELIARIAKEKEDRKACKTEICKAFAEPGDGPAIACTVTKTWLAAEIQAGFLGDKLTWPWGHAQCSAGIELDRKAIAEAAQKPSATIKLKKHNITCKLDHKDPKEGAVYDLKLSVEPTVTFENGKATKAVMGWGTIEAPVLAKTAIWPVTAVDSTFSVIANGVVRDINAFLTDKCKEVGVEIKH